MKRLLLVWAVMAGTAYGAETDDFAEAMASRTNLFIGEVFNLDVVVRSETKPQAAVMENLDGLHATLIEDGAATSDPHAWLYRYALRPTQAGEIRIPPLRFGSSLTRPVDLHVERPAPSDRMQLATVLSAPTAYVGQAVRLTTTWDSTYPLGSIKAVDFRFPVLSDPRFKVLDPYEPGKEGQDKATGIPVQGTRVLADRKSYQADGVQHQALAFSKLLLPLEAGSLAIPAAALLCAAERGTAPNGRPGQRNAFQYPAYFDNAFFDQNVAGEEWERVYAEAAPLSLEVLPLPEEGRPDNFTGLVGDFSIHVDAEPLAVRVGDPVTLTITVTARDFAEAIELPPLRTDRTLAGLFEIPFDRAAPRYQGRSRVYTQSIRPRSAAVEEIPPLQLAFFNPSSNVYVVVQSVPIPLKVSEAEAVQAYGSTVHATRLRASGEGIRQNYEKPDMLESRRPLLFGWGHAGIVLAVLLIPPLVAAGFTLASLFGARRHHIHRTAKAARAFRVFRRNAVHIVHGHAAKSTVYRELDQVLRAYLGDRLHLNPGALPFREAAARLAETGAGSAEIERLGILFALCESYRFTPDAPGTANARQIVHDAVDIVKTIERSLR